jgi:hypothetical protein
MPWIAANHGTDPRFLPWRWTCHPAGSVLAKTGPWAPRERFFTSVKCIIPCKRLTRVAAIITISEVSERINRVGAGGGALSGIPISCGGSGRAGYNSNRKLDPLTAPLANVRQKWRCPKRQEKRGRDDGDAAFGRWSAYSARSASLRQSCQLERRCY